MEGFFKKSLLLIGLLATSLAAFAEEEINILFFGNSFTFRHELPSLVKEVFEEGQAGTTVNAQRVTYGGQSLFHHYNYYFSHTFIEQSALSNESIQARIDAMNALLELDEPPPEFVEFMTEIRGHDSVTIDDFPKTLISQAIARHEDLLVTDSEDRNSWDYVVLQSWQDDVADLDAGYAKYARILAEIAEQQGAEVILYFTAPSIQNHPAITPLSGPRNQADADRAISLAIDLVQELEPRAVVHVPLAINRIQQGGTDLTFRYDNDFHPNQRSAFLVANMFYAAFFGESTEGFSFDTVTETLTTGEAPNLLDPDGDPATLVFEGEEKSYLQQMAFNAVTEFDELLELAQIPVQSINILTIGNSFADNALTYLEEIADSVSGCELFYHRANRGGHSFEMHYDLLQDSEANPLVRPYTSKGNSYSLKELLLLEEWDVVTIQQVSSQSFNEASFYPYADAIVAFINEHAPGAEVVIHQTWTYAEDADRLSNFGITQEEMHHGLTEAYNGLSQHLGGLRQLKSGEAFYTSILAHPEIDLWHPTDRFHANDNGKYLAGLVWFSGLFDRSASEVSYVPAEIGVETAETLRNVAAGLKPVVKFTATRGEEQVALNWADVVHDDFISYNLYRGTEPGIYAETPLATGLTASEYLDTDVVNGTTYYYVVTAIFAGGQESNPSTERSATPMDPLLIPPMAPNGFTATPGIGESLLEWAYNDEPDFASFTVYRGTESGVYGSTPIAEGLTASEYVDTNVADHATYYYVVTAVDIRGNESDPSEERSVTFGPPAAPTGFRAAPGNEWVRLTWDHNLELDFAGYTIYRGTESGVYDETPIVQGLTISEFMDASVTNDTTYYYAITAVDMNGNESAMSVEAEVTPTEDATYLLDIVGNNLGLPGGEFADYSSLNRNAAWGDSSDDDGVVRLSVSRTGFNGDVSLTRWFEAYAGPGSEIVYTKGPPSGGYNASSASEAIEQGAFIAIKLDSTQFCGAEFTLEAIAVQQWRERSTSATYFQLAYDADGDGYDINDLIGSPVFSDGSGAINSFEVSSELSTAFKTQHEVRLYYWGQADTWSAASVHLFNVEAAYRLNLDQDLGASLTYYVSPDGDDAADGRSPSTPWRTLGRVNAQSLAPGDRVLLEGGATFTDAGLQFLAEDAGSAEDPIVIGSFGEGRAIIKPAADVNPIELYNTAGFIIEDLVLEGIGLESSSQRGIFAYMDLPEENRLASLTIRNCEIRELRTGITIGAWAMDGSFSGFEDVLIEQTLIHSILEDGIVTYGMYPGSETEQSHRNIVIRDCEIFGVTGNPAKTDGHSGSGIILSGVIGGLIDRCYVHQNGGSAGNLGGGGPLGIWTWGSDSVTIQHSLVHDQKTAPGVSNGGGFGVDGGATNIIVQYCYAYRNEGPAFFVAAFDSAPPVNNVTFRYNVAWRNGQRVENGMAAGFHFSKGSDPGASLSNVIIHNNLIYTENSTGGPTVVWQEGVMSQLRLWNNVFAVEGGERFVDVSDPAACDYFTFQNNAYWAVDDDYSGGWHWGGSTYNTISDWRLGQNTPETLAGQATGLTQDPRITSLVSGSQPTSVAAMETMVAFRLLFDSPLIDAGLDLRTPAFGSREVGHQDFFGGSIPAGNDFDIGPQERMPRAQSANFLTERPPWAGVWFNTFGQAYDLSPYSHFLAGEAGRLRWDNLQPGPDEFDFSSLGEVLERVHSAGHYYYCELWTGHMATPEWVYDAGVPRVIDVEGESYGYYSDPLYQDLLSNFFHELAAYIASLPEEYRDRIAFLQPGFGSTGDRQVYKDDPADPQYAIDSTKYLAYMQNVTLAWHAAFDAHPELSGIRFLWNIDDYDGSNPEQLDGVPDHLRGEMLYGAWMKDNFNIQLRKQQFTLAIGYMDVNERNQDQRQRDLFYGTSEPPRWGGNPEFVRGEHNEARWANTSMAQAALKWHYYWTAISGIDRGLDGWETNSSTNLFSGDFNEAFEFAHRHAFYKRPQTSPYAFVALRDVLDYSDGGRFPPQDFGGGSVARSNTARINAILDAYSAYGAANDDTESVQTRGGNNYLQNSNGLNDVVWNVIDRNYRRHMVQLDPNGTSVGWWRVGSTDQPYGRFARAFENSTGRNAMYFRFVDEFIDSPPYALDVKVIYFDEFEGSTWELRYDDGSGDMAVAFAVEAEGDGLWKTKTVTLTDAVLAGNGPMGADLALVNTDDNDDKFHLIEVRKNYDYEAFALHHGLSEGPSGDDRGNGVSNFLQFALGGDPTGSADSGYMPHLELGTDFVTYTIYRRSNPLSGVNYDVQFSRDLNEWTSLDLSGWAPSPVSETMERVDLPIDTESEPRLFFRLNLNQVSLPGE